MNSNYSSFGRGVGAGQ